MHRQGHEAISSLSVALGCPARATQQQQQQNYLVHSLCWKRAFYVSKRVCPFQTQHSKAWFLTEMSYALVANKNSHVPPSETTYSSHQPARSIMIKIAIDCNYPPPYLANYNIWYVSVLNHSIVRLKCASTMGCLCGWPWFAPKKNMLFTTKHLTNYPRSTLTWLMFIDLYCSYLLLHIHMFYIYIYMFVKKYTYSYIYTPFWPSESAFNSKLPKQQKQSFHPTKVSNTPEKCQARENTPPKKIMDYEWWSHHQWDHHWIPNHQPK